MQLTRLPLGTAMLTVCLACHSCTIIIIMHELGTLKHQLAADDTCCTHA
jgi:hypothetical protein